MFFFLCLFLLSPFCLQLSVLLSLSLDRKISLDSSSRITPSLIHFAFAHCLLTCFSLSLSMHALTHTHTHAHAHTLMHTHTHTHTLPLSLLSVDIIANKNDNFGSGSDWNEEGSILWLNAKTFFQQKWRFCFLRIMFLFRLHLIILVLRNYLTKF